MNTVLTKHPEYSGADFEMMRDCEDEALIKKKNIKYLPMTSGQRAWNQQNGCVAEDIETPYGAYKTRAEFPDILGPAVRGFLGVAFRDDAQIELPKRIEHLIDDIGNGQSIYDHARTKAEYQLMYGRAPSLTDWKEETGILGRACITPYSPFSLTNWKTVKVNGDEKSILTVFHEQELNDADDLFGHEYISVYRVMYIDESGRLKARLYKDSDEGAELSFEELPDPSFQFGEIPAVVAGSTSVGFGRDIIPMQGIARNALKYYQVSADYYQSLYMSAVSTPVVTGASDESMTVGLGPETAIVTTSNDAKVFFLETNGNGIEANRNAMLDQMQRAAENGHKLLDTGNAQSGEALKTRVQSKNATLKSVILSQQNAIRKELEYAALWSKSDPGEIVYESNLEFIDNSIDPQLLKAFSDTIMAGNMPKEILYEYLQRTGHTTKTIEELDGLIESEEIFVDESYPKKESVV